MGQPNTMKWYYISNDMRTRRTETSKYPLLECEFGKWTSRQIQPKPVEEYLKLQGRFKHLLNNPDALKQIQAIAESNIQKYNLKVQASA